jgi:hypothetical protein
MRPGFQSLILFCHAGVSPSSSVPPVDLPVPTFVSVPTPTESGTEPEGPVVPAPAPTGSAEGDLQKFTGSIGAPIGAVTRMFYLTYPRST